MATKIGSASFLKGDLRGGPYSKQFAYKIQVVKQKLDTNANFYKGVESTVGGKKELSVIPGKLFYPASKKGDDVKNLITSIIKHLLGGSKTRSKADPLLTKLLSTTFKFTPEGSKTSQDVTLKVFVNDPDFGGKLPGKKAGEFHEERIYISMEGVVAVNKKPRAIGGKDTGQIEAIKQKLNSSYVPIVIPGINTSKNPYKVASCVWMDNPRNPQEINESGTLPKADFRFIDEKGQSILFFSYKANQGVKELSDGTFSWGYSDASAFQQYSGITDKVPGVHSKPEVQNLIKYVQYISKKTKRGKEVYEWPKGLQLAVSIKDDELKRMAIFGLGAKGSNTKFGVDNCQLVMQGRVQIRSHPSHKNMFTMTADHMMINNGQHLPEFDEASPYCPYFVQRTEKGRGVFGIPDIRICIYPKRKATGGYKFMTPQEIYDACNKAGLNPAKI